MANERCASTAIMPLLLIKPLYSNQSTVHDGEIRWAIDSASSVRKPRASEHRCRKAIERLLCGAPTVSNFFCRFVMPQNEPIRLEIGSLEPELLREYCASQYMLYHKGCVFVYIDTYAVNGERAPTTATNECEIVARHVANVGSTYLTVASNI